MSTTVTQQQLEGFLVDLRESLEFEINNWLDLTSSNEDKATVAKAIIAIANHGGGFILLGYTEVNGVYVESEGRPPNFDAYNQDSINGIVQNYCDPPFHCAVHLVPSPEGRLFPVIVIPGDHKVPIKARRAGPHGQTVQNHAIYIRKPGPRSEVPQSAQDWDQLLDRCLRNRRDELLDQMRDLISGVVPQVVPTDETDQLLEFQSQSFSRWQALSNELPNGSGPKFEHGYYSFAYEIVGTPRHVSMQEFSEILRSAEVRHTGWPPFWYPTRRGIEPYPLDGGIECWLGGDSETPPTQRDPAHSDFWRIQPNGFAYLIRGYQEDAGEVLRRTREPYPPAEVFDLTLPIWRIGEAMIHAKRLAEILFDGPTTLKFRAQYTGLSGRQLTSLSNRRDIRDGRISRQDTIELITHVETASIEANLPEILHPMLIPLYSVFDFFQLPMFIVTEELDRLRSNRF